MSILSSLYHGEIHDLPGATHNLAPGQPQNPARMDAESEAMCPPVASQPGTQQQNEASASCIRARQHAREEAPRPTLSARQAAEAAGSLNCVSRSRNAYKAKLEGGLRPDLYYTGQEAVPGRDGWVESPHTVASKLESKEEFPQG